MFKPFLSKSGKIDADLDENRKYFVQMLGKKCRFGQKCLVLSKLTRIFAL
jgi:hypothetical protein